MKQVRLGDVVKFIRGITFKPSDVEEPFQDGNVVCFRTKNVQSDIELTDLIGIPLSFVKRGEQFVNEGDILVSSANSWNLVGKCSWVPNLNYKATIGGFISAIRANESALFPRYLYYWFSSDDIQKAIRNCGRQTTNISNLDFNRCLDLQIPLPPLSEQKRIASILDKADAIRRKRQKAIELCEEFLRAVFLDMFGDPVTNPKGWAVKRLGDVACLDRGRSRHRPRNAPHLYNGKYPFIQTGDVTYSNGRIKKYTQTYSEDGLAQSKLWKAGTLCITIAANIAHTGVLMFDACFPDSMVGLLVGENLDTNFVRGWFVVMQKHIDGMATQVAQKNINLEILRELEIFLPSYELQKRFSDIVDAVYKIEDKHISLTKQEDLLFNALSQRAFRGEL